MTIEYKDFRGLIVYPEPILKALKSFGRSEEEAAQFFGSYWYKNGFAAHTMSILDSVRRWTDDQEKK